MWLACDTGFLLINPVENFFQKKFAGSRKDTTFAPAFQKWGTQFIENSIRQAGLPARRKALIVPLAGGIEGVGRIFEQSEKIIDKVERLVQASTENKIIESVDFLRMNVAGSS